MGSDHTDIGKRVREIPCIHDLEVRRKVVDQFDDYAQILSYPMPPLELLANGEQVEKYAKLVNDGFADICEKYPDYFPGWVAQAPLTAPDAGVREVTRAIKNGRSVCRSTPMSLESRSTIRPSSRSTPP